MSNFFKRVCLRVSLLSMSSLAFAVNDNPATIQYVDDAVSNAANTAGSGISILNRVISVNPTISIGDFYQGGIVFWVDATTQHGLAVSLRNQSNSIAFTSNTPDQIPARANGIGAGLINTTNILAVQRAFSQTSANAALNASAFSVQPDGLTIADCQSIGTGSKPNPGVTCYGQWYLGSPGEYQLLATNITLINAAITAAGGTAIDTTETYWTSTVANSDYGQVYSIVFGTGIITSGTFDTGTYAVRAIRQF